MCFLKGLGRITYIEADLFIVGNNAFESDPDINRKNLNMRTIKSITWYLE